MWLVQLRGEFTCNTCPRPQGADAPTGTVITLILDADAEQQYSFALSDTPVDVALLGTVLLLGTPAIQTQAPLPVGMATG